MHLRYWEEIIDHTHCVDCGAHTNGSIRCPMCTAILRKIEQTAKADAKFKQTLENKANGRFCMDLGRNEKGSHVGYIASKEEMEDIERLRKLMEESDGL